MVVVGGGGEGKRGCVCVGLGGMGGGGGGGKQHNEKLQCVDHVSSPTITPSQ